ncbi:hypothetical protein RBE51_18425 [Pseudomonas taiwanensis]|uniref:hypothetical protein n=1 Tax=Pseudomonas taiwanensis TaxID=470150 RepID=UPI0028E047ED|nr:hypothetical protein [Pseudomonas taiwanensis]MDT8924773.1 hypothetical protein [Pseudomonas taiwanensis]
MAAYLESFSSLGIRYLTHRHSSLAMGLLLAPHFKLSAGDCLKVRHSQVAALCARKVSGDEEIEALLMGFARQRRPTACHNLLDRQTLEQQWQRRGCDFLGAFASALAAHANSRATPEACWVEFALEHEFELAELAQELQLGADLAVAALHFGLKTLLQTLQETILYTPAKNDLDHLMKLEALGERFDAPRKRSLLDELKPDSASGATLTLAIQAHDYHSQGDYAATVGKPKDVWTRLDAAEVAAHLWPSVKTNNPLPLIALMNRDFPTLENALDVQDILPPDLFREIDAARSHCLEKDLEL